ncbi:hypothetical protein EGR_04372 [Echinococcus granulosus]|uniref:Uncharacterized protein n=1 Tax=Echinococcus granulosus TaxID=6210 RepID=W6UI31_ECHGR|nr:hypothetical protein EGR_04372 [Echinococcus granulosus]EUB60746.1 hypothetical protein EGR_04372 [Echinococcus granulosus]
MTPLDVVVMVVLSETYAAVEAGEIVSESPCLADINLRCVLVSMPLGHLSGFVQATGSAEGEGEGRGKMAPGQVSFQALIALLLDTGQAPSELEVRGQLLQLADLLSWDAKCNRVLHDLVVSCYGAPDYLAKKAKETSRGGGRFHFNRNFPHNLETPPRHALKPRKLRPQKPPMSEVDESNQSQLEREAISDVALVNSLHKHPEET